MKKFFKKMALGVAALSVTLVSVGSIEAMPTKGYSKLVVFGDSHSDTGMAHRVTNAIVETGEVEGAYVKPGDLYWNNRYSNGPVFVDHLAEKLGVEVEGYAIGGATTDYHNYSEWMDYLMPTGVLGQIQMYANTLGREGADKDALYFISGGTNDYCMFYDYALEGTLDDVADQVVSNMETAVRHLTRLGAENFMVMTPFDLSILPAEIDEYRTQEALYFSERVMDGMYRTLKPLEAELDINIIIVNGLDVTEYATRNHYEYGIRYIGVPAQPTWPELKPVQENPNEYLSFDEWHFSASAHEAFADFIYDEYLK